MRACPHCLAPHVLDGLGACGRCLGHWLPGAAVEALAPGRLAVLRRFVARGPPTPQNCPDCRVALKAFDVPGFQHEGDLFWGHAAPRAPGTFVAQGCARCGGCWIEADEDARAGGARVARDALARLADGLA